MISSVSSVSSVVKDFSHDRSEPYAGAALPLRSVTIVRDDPPRYFPAVLISDLWQGQRDRFTPRTQDRKAARPSAAAGTHSFSYRRSGTDQAATRGRRPALGHEESGQQSQAPRRYFNRRNHPGALLLLL